MNRYLSYFLFEKQITANTAFNATIYYLKKAPIIGSHISSKLYQFVGLKKIIATCYLIFTFLFTPIKKIAWIGCYYMLGSFLQSLILKQDILSVVMEMSERTWFLSMLLWLFLVPLFLQIPYRAYNIIGNRQLNTMLSFQLARKEFLYSQLYLKLLWEWLCYFLPFVIVGVLSNQFLMAMNLFFSYGIFSFSGEVLRRFFFKYQVQKKLFFWTGYFVCWFLLVYLSIKYLLNGGTPLFFTLAGTFFLLLFVVVLFFSMKNYPIEKYLYYLVADALRQFEAIDDVVGNEYIQDGLTMQKSLTLEPLKSKDIQERQYLNALLFSRYRKILNRSFLFRWIALVITGIILVILAFLFPTFISEEKTIQVLPSLFFIMYLLSFGKKIVQLSFVNCDVSMLNYPFYREPQTIIQGFWYRLRETLRYNSVFAGTLFIILLLIVIVSQRFEGLTFILLSGFCLLSLTLLFSFHELFIYYLLQPFTRDMKVINPLYKGVSAGFYLIAYTNVRLDFTGMKYVFILSVISLLYVIVGMFIIINKAPKTFRIKE